MGARLCWRIVGVVFRISQDFLGPASLIFGYALAAAHRSRSAGSLNGCSGAILGVHRGVTEGD